MWVRGECSINQHLHVVPQLPRISSTPLVSLLASEVCYECRGRANVGVSGVDGAIGVGKVDFDEDTLGARLGGEVVVRLVHQLARRACGAREEDDGATVFGEMEKAVDVL